MTLSAIVVDDSIVFRKTIRDCLESIGDVRIVDVARDGMSAVEKIRKHKPDLVTLDVEMPGMDGLQVLEALKNDDLKTNILMVSSLTQRGAESTTKALSLGAFDFVLKPCHSDPAANIADLTRQLRTRVSAIARRNKPVATRSAVSKTATTPVAPLTQKSQPTRKPDVVLIGISTGGPQALRTMIPALPANLPIPVVVVQHMPAMFTASMAADLNKLSALNVYEATNDAPLKAGSVYIAPGGRQLRMNGHRGALRAEVTDDPPYQNCKPSVDYLFHSARKIVGGNCLSLIMTGMGNDGLESCRELCRAGGTVWAQDETSSTVYGMPKQIVDNGLADSVFPLDQIASAIVRHCNQNARNLVSS